MSVNIFGLSGGSRLSSDVDKKYVDQKFATLSTNLATKASKSGDTLQGDLNMGGNKISNVAEPIHNLDAVSKQYVDEKFTNLYTLSTTGLVPPLTNNRDRSGYVVSISSEIENHQATECLIIQKMLHGELPMTIQVYFGFTWYVANR